PTLRRWRIPDRRMNMRLLARGCSNGEGRARSSRGVSVASAPEDTPMSLLVSQRTCKYEAKPMDKSDGVGATGQPKVPLSSDIVVLSTTNAPNGIRTRATALKGPRPGPLVDGGPVGPGYRYMG